jgi:predicted kinase
MPSKPLRLCNYYGCTNMTTTKYCKAHEAQEHKQISINTHATINMICGPSGAGKTYYVNQHKKDKDIVIDLDEIKARLSNTGWYQARDEWVRPAITERDRILSKLKETDTAWFIVSAPTRQERRKWKKLLRPKKVIILATPYEVCANRLKEDKRRYNQCATYQDICKRWWREYETDFGEEIINDW